MTRHDDLAAFRLAWADKKLAAVEKSREHSTALSKKTETLGMHLPIGINVRKEGGWKEESAVRVAVARVLKCIALGGTYVKWKANAARALLNASILQRVAIPKVLRKACMGVIQPRRFLQ